MLEAIWFLQGLNSCSAHRVIIDQGLKENGCKGNLIRHPPENSEHASLCLCLSNPNPFKIVDALASADQASISTKRVCISAIFNGSFSSSAFCSKSTLSLSDASTVSSNVTLLPGASCDTPPIWAFYSTLGFPDPR